MKIKYILSEEEELFMVSKYFIFRKIFESTLLDYKLKFLVFKFAPRISIINSSERLFDVLSGQTKVFYCKERKNFSRN
jgi:hypothetical protein